MGRRGDHKAASRPRRPARPGRVAGARQRVLRWMGANGYRPRTIGNRRGGLAALVGWLEERGVTVPSR